jgi:hypothetical protein
VADPLGATQWRACQAEHHDALMRVFAFSGRHAGALRLGILGTLAVFLPAAIGADAGWLRPLSFADTRAFFRFAIACTVLPLGWLGESWGRPDGGSPRVPFPVHIQALIGTRAVLWLFRLVGIVWLGLGVLHATFRLGLGGWPD